MSPSRGDKVSGGTPRAEVEREVVRVFGEEDCVICTVTIKKDGEPTWQQMHDVVRKIAGAVDLKQFWTIEGKIGGKRLHLNYIFGLGFRWNGSEPDKTILEGLERRLKGASSLVGYLKGPRFMNNLLGTARYHCKEIPVNGESAGAETRWGFENGVAKE